MKKVKKEKSEWWHEFFKTFQPVLGVVAQKITNAQVRYIARKLALKPGRTFLDCPCGVGRIALPLARKGVRVTGVDIIPEYLEEAAGKAKRRGLKLDLVHSDMRKITFKNKFEAAGNLWTSFGYFEKETDNRLTLKRMYEALKPGGKFLLHLINRDWIIANMEQTGWFEAGNMKVLQNRRFDYATSTSRDTWHFIRDGEEKTHEITLRLYSYHELIAMFKSVGFVDIEGFGSVKDEPVSRDLRFIFIFGTKPKTRR
jgi:cyclopropane fatty-acyl-phospholipid synthase-like methyltransferase